MRRGLLCLQVTAAVTTLAVSGCGSTTTGPLPATTTAAVLDHCIVGAWVSTNISGPLNIAGGPVTLSGGAGERLSITASGHITTDDSATAPLTGTASDGSAYKLAQTGTATGAISASGGRLAVTLQQPTPLTLTLVKNGTVVQTQHPGAAAAAYTCSPGRALVITGSGGTVSTYSPG